MKHVTEAWMPPPTRPLLEANPYRRRCTAAATLTGLALALLLTACGQKGPLFIPDTAPAAQRATLPQTLLHLGNSAASPNAKDDAGEPAATPSQARQPSTP